jgi:hypothetical protein
MKNFTIINKDIFKQLTEDELLIYCYGTLETKRNEQYKFSSSILFYDLNVNTRRLENKIKTALNGLVTKGFISKVANDVYIIHETKKESYYFVLYDIEFEALKHDSTLLRYFCFIVSCLNNITQELTMANSFIKKGFDDLCNSNTGISNKTVVKYNEILIKLNLIIIIKGNKKDTKCSATNIIKRVNVNDDYKQASKDKDKTAQAETKDLSNAKETKAKENNNSTDKDKLLNDISNAVQVNTNDISISKNQLNKIKEVGQDDFISILKDCRSKYPNIINDQTMAVKDRINKLINTVLKNDLESGLKAIQKQQEKLKDEYFVKHRTDDNCFMSKAGLNQTIDEIGLNYDKVIKELEKQNIITDEVRSYIKEYIPKELKRRQEEHQRWLDMEDYSEIA